MVRKAGDIVSALFSEKFGPGFMQNARSSADLFSSWEKIASSVFSVNGEIPAAAVHSRIRELERGLLIIEADHPGWIQILQTKQAELLSAVQKRFQELEIKGLVFRLIRSPESVSAESVQTPESAPPVLPPVHPTEDAPTNAEEIPVTNGSITEESAMNRETENSNPTEPLGATDTGRDDGDKTEFYAALKDLEESIKKRNSR